MPPPSRRFTREEETHIARRFHPEKRGGVQKGWNEFAIRVQSAGSAVRCAEPPRDARAQVGFRGRRRDVHPAVDEAVNQRPDDLGAVQRLAARAAIAGSEPIEVVDLSIEEDDRDF
jgi:hypothetical protein